MKTCPFPVGSRHYGTHFTSVKGTPAIAARASAVRKEEARTQAFRGAFGGSAMAFRAAEWR